MFGGGGGPGGGSGNFHVNFDGSGGPGFGGGGGFESMFNMGGMGGGMGGGRQRQQQAPSQELYPKNSSTGIAPLGKAKFPNASSKFVWIVVFYANDDPASQQIKGAIEKLAAGVKGSFKVGAFNCKRSPQEMQFCTDKEINVQKPNALPSFGVVVNGEFFKFDSSEKAPSMKAIHEFALSEAPFSLIQQCNHPAHVEDRLTSVAKSQQKVGSILLLTDKYETSSKYMALAYQYRNEFVFGESRAKTLSMAQKYKIKKYPVLVAFVPKKDDPENVEMIRLDQFQTSQLSQWVDQLIKSFRTKPHATTSRRR